MTQDSFVNIGKLVATFGVGGQLILLHGLGKKTQLKGLEVLMIERQKNDLIPYFVVETKAKTDTEIYVSLEDVSTKERAKLLVGKPVWMKEADFKRYASKEASIYLLGYTVYNHGTAVGVVEEVIEQPHQILVRIRYNAKDVLVPIVEAFVDDINNRSKKIMLQLPDGLLDL
jgi:16S rRNA processing protein RimM